MGSKVRSRECGACPCDLITSISQSDYNSKPASDRESVNGRKVVVVAWSGGRGGARKREQGAARLMQRDKGRI